MFRLKQGIQLQYLNMKPGFMIFWGVILLIIVFQYLTFFYFVPRGAGGTISVQTVVGGHLVAVVIFMGIATGAQCWETMPYSLNLGSTRGEFWLASTVFNFLHSLVMAGILVVLSLAERVFFTVFGWEHHFMGAVSAIDLGIVLTFLIVNFAVIAVAAAVVFLAVFIVYRYGGKTLMVLGAALVSGVIVFPAFRSAMVQCFKYVFLIAFGRENPWLGVGLLLVFSFLCYLLAYPLVKGSQVKN